MKNIEKWVIGIVYLVILTVGFWAPATFYWYLTGKNPFTGDALSIIEGQGIWLEIAAIIFAVFLYFSSKRTEPNKK